MGFWCTGAGNAGGEAICGSALVLGFLGRLAGLPGIGDLDLVCFLVVAVFLAGTEAFFFGSADNPHLVLIKSVTVPVFFNLL